MRQLNANQPVVDGEGKATDYFRRYDNESRRWDPIVGEGDPEGVVEGLIYQLYIDKNGTTGSIEYRKMQAQVDGDRKKGSARS